MREKFKAYIINESRGPEQEPIIGKVTSGIVKFTVPILQEADLQNRNGRIYSWEVLEEAVMHPTLQERLNTRTLYCECGHPKEQSVDRQVHLERDRATCIIKDLSLEKPFIRGKLLETCATERGRDLMGLIVENGCKVAFSMRGLGRVVERGGTIYVQRPLRIITWDEVVHPSVATAYMGEILESNNEKVMSESLTILHEEDFAKYLFDCSSDAKNVLDSMNVDPSKAKFSINNEGFLSIDDQQGTNLLVLTECGIRKEIDNYLLRLNNNRIFNRRK